MHVPILFYYLYFSLPLFELLFFQNFSVTTSFIFNFSVLEIFTLLYYILSFCLSFIACIVTFHSRLNSQLLFRVLLLHCIVHLLRTCINTYHVYSRTLSCLQRLKLHANCNKSNFLFAPHRLTYYVCLSHTTT